MPSATLEQEDHAKFVVKEQCNIKPLGSRTAWHNMCLQGQGNFQRHKWWDGWWLNNGLTIDKSKKESSGATIGLRLMEYCVVEYRLQLQQWGQLNCQPWRKKNHWWSKNGALLGRNPLDQSDSWLRGTINQRWPSIRRIQIKTMNNALDLALISIEAKEKTSKKWTREESRLKGGVWNERGQMTIRWTVKTKACLLKWGCTWLHNVLRVNS